MTPNGSDLTTAPRESARPSTVTRLLVATTTALLLAGCGTASTGSIPVDDDPPAAGTFRGGPDRPGRTTALRPVGDDTTADPTTTWTLAGSGPVIASPVATGDRVVVPFGDDELVAVDPRDGTVAWRVDAPDADASGAVVGDHVLVAGLDGSLAAYAVEDGTVAWSVDLGGRVRSSPLVVDDVVVVGVGRDLVARSVTDGAARWSTALGARIDGSAALAGDVVVVGDTANGLFAVDPEDGEVVVEAGLGPVVDDTFVPGIAATPAVTDDTIVLGSTNGRLAGLDRDDLAERWTQDVGAPIYASVAVTADGGTGVVAAADGRVRAFDLSDGSVDWETAVGDAVYASPVLTGDDDPTVLVLEEGGSLVGLALADGEQRWRTPVGEDGNYMSSTPIVVDGTIVVGANTGDLVGLR